MKKKRKEIEEKEMGHITFLPFGATNSMTN